MSASKGNRTASVFLIAAGALLVLVSIGYLANKDRIQFLLKTPAQKFQTAWTQDLETLRTTGALPKAWDDIQKIEIRTEPSPVRDWMESLPSPIQTKPSGHHRLRILGIYWTEGNRYGATLEYSLVDLGSGNTVWELTRRHQLGFVY